ncbi:hypothetical protein [Bartonella sp. CB178]|uniref:hypothetical protein n=1 Tax=Bartonella sp. CB178 TaxID=3112255 RepID=UPI003FA5AEB1
MAIGGKIMAIGDKVMTRYLETIYHGISLYYAGRENDTIRLEPKKQNAVPFISQEAAQHAAKNLAQEYRRDDFFIVQ